MTFSYPSSIFLHTSGYNYGLPIIYDDLKILKPTTIDSLHQRFGYTTNPKQHQKTPYCLWIAKSTNSQPQITNTTNTKTLWIFSIQHQLINFQLPYHITPNSTGAIQCNNHTQQQQQQTCRKVHIVLTCEEVLNDTLTWIAQQTHYIRMTDIEKLPISHVIHHWETNIPSNQWNRLYLCSL
jgi:hypothetical protein